MKLLIIDDNFQADDPAIVMTTIKLPDIEPVFYKTGKDFFDALDQDPAILFQSIIVLDLSFGSGQMQGIDILRKIREISLLIPVIIFTGADEPSQLIPDFINLDTNAYITKTTSNEEFVEKVKRCAEMVQNNVAAALTEWLDAHPEEEKKDSYIFTVDGKHYSLNQISEELKQSSFVGKQFINRILRLTVDLISRNKESL
ncbi:MAG: response regulator [Spirochaetaceae bacterium]|nr:response regulator [Spirochaetaceae bacterium]